MIERVAIAGTDLDLGEVFAALTIRHGRSSVDESPLGSTVTLSLVDVTREFVAPFRVGAPIEIDVAELGDANAVTNPSFEASTAGWGTGGTNTLDTLPVASEGARALVVTFGNSVNLAFTSPALVAGEIYQLSIDVYIPNAWNGGAPRIENNYGGTELHRTDADLSIREAWQRISVTAKIATGAGNLNLTYTGATPSAGRQIYADAARISTATAPRFRGRITDALLDADEATLALVASSTLTRVGGREIGADAWPAESWSARVERAVLDAGLTLADLLLEVGDTDPMLAARAGSAVELAQYLADLAETEPAAIADLPDGRILVQAVSSRRATPVELDPDLVVLSPDWEQADEVTNVVRVEWDGGTVEATDTASIADFEERAPRSISTELATVTDATTRAITELNRRSRPKWTLGRADLLTLDTALTIGVPVHVTGLPAAAPRDEVIGILEGWTDSIEGDDWTTVLALSPVLLSGYGATWSSIDPAFTWDTIDPSLTWADTEELLYA